MWGPVRPIPQDDPAMLGFEMKNRNDNNFSQSREWGFVLQEPLEISSTHADLTLLPYEPAHALVSLASRAWATEPVLDLCDCHAHSVPDLIRAVLMAFATDCET